MKKKAKKSANKERPTIFDGDFSEATNGQNGNRVFVSMAKTINIGNYESLKVEYGVGRTVDDGQEFGEVMEACKADAGRSLKEMVKIVEQNIK